MRLSETPEARAAWREKVRGMKRCTYCGKEFTQLKDATSTKVGWDGQRFCSFLCHRDWLDEQS